MSPRVLLVDDEANIRRMVGALLQSDGFDTIEAPDGNGNYAPDVNNSDFTGKTFTLKVNDAFEYTCSIHPSMKAKVVLSG